MVESEIIDKLYQTKDATDDELKAIIELEDASYLRQMAIVRRKQWYGNDVFIRGLIEFSNHCRNNCYYCGIRAQNGHVARYRLSEDQILSCCRQGYQLGFRTFVLQSGEDLTYSDEAICRIVSQIRREFPECAVTLSIGEKPKSAYQAYFDAGATRYLLRHETATNDHYQMLHPSEMDLEHRKQCLLDLKAIGFQVGAGFMVGSPGQTLDHLIADLRYLQFLDPDMIGIGPFLAHKDTPFADKPNGSLKRTLNLLSILRLMFPHVLLPSTTALATLDKDGRELGILAGANVVMPNLSPESVRKLYTLYDHKKCSGAEAASHLALLKEKLESIGYKIVVDRGDVKRQI